MGKMRRRERRWVSSYTYYYYDDEYSKKDVEEEEEVSSTKDFTALFKGLKGEKKQEGEHDTVDRILRSPATHKNTIYNRSSETSGNAVGGAYTHTNTSDRFSHSD